MLECTVWESFALAKYDEHSRTIILRLFLTHQFQALAQLQTVPLHCARRLVANIQARKTV